MNGIGENPSEVPFFRMSLQTKHPLNICRMVTMPATLPTSSLYGWRAWDSDSIDVSLRLVSTLSSSGTELSLMIARFQLRTDHWLHELKDTVSYRGNSDDV